MSDLRTICFKDKEVIEDHNIIELRESKRRNGSWKKMSRNKNLIMTLGRL